MFNTTPHEKIEAKLAYLDCRPIAFEGWYDQLGFALGVILAKRERDGTYITWVVYQDGSLNTGYYDLDATKGWASFVERVKLYQHQYRG
jgi:hypothetical protein